MSRSRVDDKMPPRRESPRGKGRQESDDTLPDISMEDTDAAAQRIPEELLDDLGPKAASPPGSTSEESKDSDELGPGESFTGAPTLAPQDLPEAAALDFSELGDVDEDSYVFGAELARGGMGRILSARDRRTGRSVAIKEILPPLMAGLSGSDKDGLIARFKREALVTARLQHPSIVPVYEIGNFRGRPFFAMKKVEGEGLDTLISRRKTLAARLELLPTIVSVADALAYAHGQQVVHRDLKSSNILVGAFGETVVIDWGLAKDLSVNGDDDSIAPGTSSYDSMHPLKTVAGAIFGTPHFMPPEQARGDRVDERADVYAIGSMLYHLLSGKAPYQDTAATSPNSSLLQKLRNEPPQPLSEVVEDVPRDLLSIVDKAMSRDKGERYPSAAELAADLAAFTGGHRVGVHDYSTRELIARWLRRHKAAVATAVVLLAALIVTATISIRSVVENKNQAEAAAKVASAEKDRADTTTIEAMQFLAERGRIDLLEDRPVDAIILLSKAYKHLSDRPANRITLAAAMRSIDGLVRRIGSHESPISTMQLSHDKSMMMSSSANGSIRIWDIKTGAPVASFETGDDHQFLSPTFSSDDMQVAAAGGGALHVWQVATGKLQAKLEGNFQFASFDHRDRVVTIASDGEISAWTPETGEQVLLTELRTFGPLWSPAMSADRTALILSLPEIQVLDLTTDSLRTTSTGYNSRLAAVDYDSGARRFATVDGGGRILLWNLDNLEIIHRFNIRKASARNLSMMFSPDGELIASVTPEMNVEIFSLVTSKVVASLDARDAGVTNLLFSPDGKTLVTLGRDEVARSWEVATGRMKSTFVGHAGVCVAGVFSPDSESFFVGDLSGGIRQWDASVDILTRDRAINTSFTARDTSGRRLLAAKGDALLLLDAATLETIATVGAATNIDDSRFSGDGSRFFTGAAVYRSNDGSLVRTLRGLDEGFTAAAINTDGSVVSLSNKESFVVWNVDSGEIVYEEKDSTTMRSALFLSPRGDYGMAMLDGFRLGLIDFETGEKLDHFGDRSLTRDMVSYTSLPDHAVINRRPRSLDLVALRTGEVVRSLKGSYSFLTMAKDGVRVVATTGNQSVVWNTETGEVESQFVDPKANAIFSVAISASGDFLAMASFDTFSVYASDSQTLLLRHRIGTPSIRSIAFGENDQSLIVNAGGRALVFDIHRETRTPDEIEFLVRDRVSRILQNGHFRPAPFTESPGESTWLAPTNSGYMPILPKGPMETEAWKKFKSKK